jgi:uncharacterized membrane protein
MANFHENLDIYAGLFLILCSFAVIIFPPKFGNLFYGFRTKWTIKNKAAWAVGQNLYSVTTFGMGFIFLTIGSLKIHEEIPPYVMVLLLMVLWKTSKYFVDKYLSKKYPEI